MPGFSNIDPLSISVVTRIVFGAELLLGGVGVGKNAVSPEEEGANALALQTRQSLSTTALSLASQASQAVLRLFG